MKRLLTILFAIALVSCGKDGGNGDGESPVILDAPVLTAPADEADDVPLTPTFTWETSGEDAAYDVMLFDGAWETIAEDLNGLAYSVQDALEYETVYSWKVVAKLDGETEVSEVFTFTTESEEVVVNPPALEAPVLTVPADAATDVLLAPTFAWETSGEGVVYNVMLFDGMWVTVAEDLTTTSYTLEDELGYETTYSWKVVANLNGETKESEVFSFTTIEEEVAEPYADGDVYLYLDSQKTHPLNIIITGDGFIQEDYDSGFFDEKVDALMDMFFRVEPYKTYKEYFRVHKLIGVSNQRGASVAGLRPEQPPLRPALAKQTVDTKFGVTLSEGYQTYTYLSGQRWGVVPIYTFYDYMKECFEGVIDNEAFENTVVFILVNINAYAGTESRNPANGQSVVMVSLPATEPSYIGVMMHESGHAIGKLADEYFSGTSMLPQAEMDRIVNARKGDPWTFDANVDFSGNRDEAIWAKYYGMAGYTDVDYHEGGLGYAKGSWRSTVQSLMGNDYTSLWFNTVSREAIVRRILKIAGETFDWQEFLRKDVNTPTLPQRTIYYQTPLLEKIYD